MSEYQYVGFRAIDRPVTEKNLEFMREQSSRAEISAWSFENEYHFGDFHGDAEEMLRRGYDFHLHYANFGVRTLMIRYPNGLPDAKAAEPYFKHEALCFLKDRKGRAGILVMQPAYEPGQLDDLWDLGAFLERLLPLRAEILNGDLRPLYLANLAVAYDMNHDPEEQKEPPVPAGLGQPTKAQDALTQLYSLSKALIAAAARNSPVLRRVGNPSNQYAQWLKLQPEATKNAWLAELMADPHSAVPLKIIAEFQKNRPASSWPTAPVDRTVAELLEAAETIQRDLDREHADKIARERAKKLSEMRANPMHTLRQTEQLAKERSLESYNEIATLLADLREALSGTPQSSLAEEQARKLKAQNPKRYHLTAELRLRGFVKK
jgi:hypothetical protein